MHLFEKYFDINNFWLEIDAIIETKINIHGFYQTHLLEEKKI